MAIIVEHDKRKREILAKALDVFTEEGYEDVTFQKIADRCGITRTTLYIYFKNKHDIFLWSIKQLTAGLEKDLMAIISNKDLTAKDCLRAIFMKIMDACEENKQLFAVILVYLMQIKKSGVDPQERVQRRVIHLRHLMSTVLIRGMQTGEFRKLDVKETNALFYSLIESAIFRLAVLNQDSLSETRDILNLTIDTLLAGN